MHCNDKNQGFIYISSVMGGGEDEIPSCRSGLTNLHEQASKSSRLLVVSRISNEKVLPWMVSSTGAIRCFDTVSVSQKLSLHRHTRVPIMMHVFLWDRSANFANVGSIRARAMSTCMHSSPTESQSHIGNDNRVMPEPEPEPEREVKLERDTAGQFSFRFHDFAINKNNWV